jgi:PAS domain S-box-containing protein/putative nucleotidyltransferase with HDIG domain
MSGDRIKLLLIEDNPGDSRLIQMMLMESQKNLFDLEITDELSTGLARLSHGDIELVLLDLSLPDSQGLDTVIRTHTCAPEVSIVVLTGLDDEELALNALELGAQDYLVKGDMDGRMLSRGIRYAIERKRATVTLAKTNDLLSRAEQLGQIGSWEWDIAADQVIWSDGLYQIFGLTHQEFGATFAAYLERVHPEARERVNKIVETAFRGGGAFEFENAIVRPDGQSRVVYSRGEVLLDDRGKPSRLLGIGIDITERKRAEEDIRRRVVELEAVNRVSTAMRTAQTLSGLLHRLMDEILAILDTETGMILLYDPTSNQLLEGIDRGWFKQLPKGPMKPSEGIAGTVFAAGKMHVTREFASDSLTLETARHFIPSGWGGACLPILTVNETIGVLFVAVPLPRTLTQEEINLLQTVAEIAGNAIHRTRLNDQTITRLERITALRAIDTAISTSFDLNFILNVVLDQVKTQLIVDATDILLFNPQLNTFKYTEGRGFRFPGVANAHFWGGEGIASRAVRERVTIKASPPLQFEPSRMVLLDGEGFEFYLAVPLIVKGQVKGVLETFHRSLLDPDQEWINYAEALAGQAAIAIENAELFDGLQRSNTELSLAYNSTIEGWSRALDLRDEETEGHTLRVTEIAVFLARFLGFEEERIAHIRWGALLHDIGKMGVPDRILLKPGPLDEVEWEIMRKHPVYAHNLLSPISYLQHALAIPYCHHEKWDGSGYPRGLQGNEIPIEARLFAVVDVWDALSSDRPYRQAWKKDRVIRYIQDQAGKHFDPQIVSLFLRELTGTNEWIKFAPHA